MFCAIETRINSRGEFWTLIDSEMGKYDTGWATFRPAPMVIIDIYLRWGQDPLPNLRLYYSSQNLSLNKTLNLLEEDRATMGVWSYDESMYDKYYTCVKQHLYKLNYIGMLK